MVFSKSFGYALRGILYVALIGEKRRRVQLDEMAAGLAVPRHFLAKVMKNIVKEGVLSSQKGPQGGFSSNEKTLQTTLMQLVNMTGEVEGATTCVLRLRKCNAQHPCPMHAQVEELRKRWRGLLASVTIDDLLRKDQPDFIRSIAAI